MKIVLFANTDWYLFNFRLPLAIDLRDAGHDVLLLSPDGPYGKLLREAGFRWHPVALNRRSLNPFRESAFVLSLWKLLRRERPDVIHGFTLKCAVYGSIAARFAGGAARVNAVTGMGYVFTSGDWKARILRPFVRAALRYALGGRRALVVLQNPDDVELFRRYGLVDPSFIRLIPGSGVDCNLFRPGDLRSADSPLRVLLPARLLWDKGVGEFVAAARKLLAEGRDIEFMLAGSPDPGNPASVSEETILEWVRGGVVTWLGHVDDMPSLFRGVDVVALPSYREGLPKGLIEAGASGCALITTNAPGCREVVCDGTDGLLIPVGDIDALARAIARLQDDVEFRRALARSAREKAVNCFDVVSINSLTVGAYREILGVP